MTEVLEYKCPACGAPLVFDGGSQNMDCAHCGNNFAVSDLREYAAAYDTGDAVCDWGDCPRESGVWAEAEQENLHLATCPSCGGELIGEAQTIAAECPYCNNMMILSGSVAGRLRPDFVIPFRLDKAAAIAALRAFYRGKLLLPRLFREQNQLERVSGVYVPFWLFDCDTGARISYKATRVSSRSDANWNYLTTKHYHLLRAGEVSFARVPVDGSRKIDDTLMEALEPFDYGQIRPFAPSYLSGFRADRFDVEAAESEKRVNERIRNSTRALFDETVRDRSYSAYQAESVNIRLNRGRISYALLPVWLLNTRYGDKAYLFAMNGQTGKFVGRLPVSRGKFWAWFFGLFLGLSGVGALALSLAAGFI
ncbi:MAG: hypothetical protein LBS10_09520 [Gracilibacteraceae bacterium]|jgi:DNA-directed RNA polymerase subunit RPC12/RpoP|nr:hypothetical protein [Gracilibacteraceae bacterium]